MKIEGWAMMSGNLWIAFESQDEIEAMQITPERWMLAWYATRKIPVNSKDRVVRATLEIKEPPCDN